MNNVRHSFVPEMGPGVLPHSTSIPRLRKGNCSAALNRELQSRISQHASVAHADSLSIFSRSSCSRIRLQPAALSLTCSGLRAPQRTLMYGLRATVHAITRLAMDVSYFSQSGLNSSSIARTFLRSSGA